MFAGGIVLLLATLALVAAQGWHAWRYHNLGLADRLLRVRVLPK